jgi:pyruvate dehydrogenase E1 component beta subunit
VSRIIRYHEAIREAQAQLMARDPNVFILGLGAPGPTGIFGSTLGLVDEFGPDRVVDMPASENAMTGIALGTALTGRRPILVHIRVDFAVLSMEPLVNQVAKWAYMYGGKMSAPLTVRMIIGRGWGQGPQHSQSLQSWFAHIPGLKVVMPATAHDAKGMLIAAVEDEAPVILFEHRWLYGVTGHVPEAMYATPLEGARVVRRGGDVTLAATSYMVLESLRAAELLAEIGVEAEVIDLRCLTPLDRETLGASVCKTGRLVVSDTSHAAYGVGAEAVACLPEAAFLSLKAAPRRVCLPHFPTPTSPALSDHFYPGSYEIALEAAQMLDCAHRLAPKAPSLKPWRDVPDPSFTGPY